MAAPIRVLHIIDHLGSGGAQEVVLDLARHLDPNRFEVEVWALHGRGSYFEELEALGISVRSLVNSKYNPWLPLGMWRALRAQTYDILHLHLSFSTLLGGFLGRLSGASRIVVTIHALRNQSLPWVFPMWGVLSPLYTRFVAEVRRSVDELRESGIPQEKIALIILGTDKARMGELVPTEPLDSLPAGEGPVLLNIARLHPHKGQRYMIDAMPKIVSEFPAARLLLVGDGPQLSLLQRDVERLGLQDSVLLLGFRRDLEALYAGCDLFVMPSVREGMGLVTIQALAMGKPVVATDVGAISEAVIPGRTGLLVSPRDPDALAKACIRLLRDKDMSERFGKQGRAFVREHFALETMVDGYEKLYTSLCDSGG
ncbi:MAG: glycosyltransferase [Anaerolineae bacterium]